MTERELRKLVAEKYPHTKYDSIFFEDDDHFDAGGWEKYASAV